MSRSLSNRAWGSQYREFGDRLFKRSPGPIYEYAAAFGVELVVIVGYEDAAGTGVERKPRRSSQYPPETAMDDFLPLVHSFTPSLLHSFVLLKIHGSAISM